MRCCVAVQVEQLAGDGSALAAGADSAWGLCGTVASAGGGDSLRANKASGSTQSAQRCYYASCLLSCGGGVGRVAACRARQRRW